MTEPRIPTTVPSPVDRDEFRFMAVDAAGADGTGADDRRWRDPHGGRVLGVREASYDRPIASHAKAYRKRGKTPTAHSDGSASPAEPPSWRTRGTAHGANLKSNGGYYTILDLPVPQWRHRSRADGRAASVAGGHEHRSRRPALHPELEKPSRPAQCGVQLLRLGRCPQRWRATTPGSRSGRTCTWVHANIIEYQHRPFRDVGQMDAALWDAWWTAVGPDDALVCVGDLAMGAAVSDETWERVTAAPGAPKVLIVGNHDVGGSGRLRVEGFQRNLAVLVSPGEPPLIWTHAPLPDVPDGPRTLARDLRARQS